MIAYVPLDLPKVNITQEEIKSLPFADYHPWNDMWSQFVVKGRVDKWDNIESHQEGFSNRFNDGDATFNPYLGDLREKFELALSYLPYKECTYAQILSQKKSIVPHWDHYGEETIPNEPEPAGLKIMLTHQDARSFFVMKDANSKRDFIKIPPDTNSFAINERSVLHGARYIGKPKYVISTFGIIDKNKHAELIERSREKYKDWIIEYGI